MAGGVTGENHSVAVESSRGRAGNNGTLRSPLAKITFLMLNGIGLNDKFRPWTYYSRKDLLFNAFIDKINKSSKTYTNGKNHEYYRRGCHFVTFFAM